MLGDGSIVTWIRVEARFAPGQFTSTSGDFLEAFASRKCVDPVVMALGKRLATERTGLGGISSRFGISSGLTVAYQHGCKQRGLLCVVAGSGLGDRGVLTDRSHRLTPPLWDFELGACRYRIRG